MVLCGVCVCGGQKTKTKETRWPTPQAFVHPLSFFTLPLPAKNTPTNKTKQNKWCGGCATSLQRRPQQRPWRVKPGVVFVFERGCAPCVKPLTPTQHACVAPSTRDGGCGTCCGGWWGGQGAHTHNCRCRWTLLLLSHARDQAAACTKRLHSVNAHMWHTCDDEAVAISRWCLSLCSVCCHQRH